MLSIIIHLLAVIVVLVVPKLPYFVHKRQAEAEAKRLAMMQPKKEPMRFVFVQPRVETPARRPTQEAPASDRDRTAMTRERPPTPKNQQPFARGNTPEYVERSPPPSPQQMQRQPGPPQPPTDQPSQNNTQNAANNASDFRLPEIVNHTPAAHDTAPAGGRPNTGPLSAQSLSRFAERAAFDNPNGGNNSLSPYIQFDTKGVEFGPWLRRFIAQIKRNWFVPQAAMSLRGHVVITFNVHKSGALTDVSVIGPSVVDSFNNAAFGALASSNPTEPLPTEYPSEKAFFTVTFFYNERPAEGP